MFERKTFTIYPVASTSRPIFIRAGSANDAIYEFARSVGLEAFGLKIKADAHDVTYTDFTLGTGKLFYCYESQPNELAELGAAS